MKNFEVKGKITITNFTIAVPVFNKIDYVKESINSVLNQTFKDFELVIVDDYSTDGVWEYVQSIKDPRVRIFRNEKNLGIVANWRRCIEKANGKWFKFLMSDDILFPRSLEVIQKMIEECSNNFVIVSSGVGFTDIREVNKYLYEYPKDVENVERYLRSMKEIIIERKKFIQTWAMPNAYTLLTNDLKNLIRTEEYKEVEERLGQTGHDVDYFILYAIAKKYKTMIEMDLPMYGVRSHASNLSKSYNKNLLYHLDGDKYIHYLLYDYKGFEHLYIVRHAFKIYFHKILSNKRKIFTLYPLRWTYQLITFLVKHFFNIKPL